jgi:hypothetical protein
VEGGGFAFSSSVSGVSTNGDFFESLPGIEGVMGSGLSGVPVRRLSCKIGVSTTNLGGGPGGRMGGALLGRETVVSFPASGVFEKVVSSFLATFLVDSSFFSDVGGGNSRSSWIAGVATGFGGSVEGANLVTFGNISL